MFVRIVLLIPEYRWQIIEKGEKWSVKYYCHHSCRNDQYLLLKGQRQKCALMLSKSGTLVCCRHIQLRHLKYYCKIFTPFTLNETELPATQQSAWSCCQRHLYPLVLLGTVVHANHGDNNQQRLDTDYMTSCAPFLQNFLVSIGTIVSILVYSDVSGTGPS